MKKSILVIGFLLITLSFSYSEGIRFKGKSQSFIPKGRYQSIIGSTQKGGHRRSSGSHFLIPSIGYDSFIIANTGSLGLDYMYSHSSGFALYFNNAFVFGTGKRSETSHYSYDTVSRETTYSALAYAFELLFGYSGTIGSHRIGFGLGFQGAYGTIMEFGAFAMRFDYSYFFKDNLGINVSLTDGIGLTESLLPNPETSINRFSLRVGASFKL
jgi:hypothetical protein